MAEKTKNEENNRFADVIEKMEEETKKVEKEQAKKKSTAKEKNTKEAKNLPTKTKKQKAELPIKRQKELEVIEDEIKNGVVLPKEEMNKIYTKVFQNMLFAIIILIYFILINMGYISIKPEVFITDLKVFSITLVVITICVFECAYKKESGKYAINGIELLILSICTLLSIRIYTVYNSKFIVVITLVALLFAIYYVGKSIVIYVKDRRELKEKSNGIYKTAKK